MVFPLMSLAYLATETTDITEQSRPHPEYEDKSLEAVLKPKR
jgi:hypothetical protein